MEKEDFRGKNVTVMGLGLHGGGIGTVLFLSRLGARVTVTDMKSEEELDASLEKLKDAKGLRYVLGQHREEDFSGADFVIKNPSVPWDNRYVTLALEAGVPVEMDSSLFFKLCGSPIIGITGTKGKTTTSSLISEILETAGRKVVRVGIGQTSVLDKLEDIGDGSIVVFELSSWRLSALGRFQLSPHIAVLTNIYPDHLNYYGSMEDYIADKKFIFSNQKADDFCVVNHDNEAVLSLEPEIRSRLIRCSASGRVIGEGVYVDGGKIWLDDGNDRKEVLDIREISLKGEHNRSNILLAVGVAQAVGIGVEDIRRGIVGFRGIPHRLEMVRELDGAKYYNDTAATTPESAISGISSFEEPLVLICGGSDKNLDMEIFGNFLSNRKNIKRIIFLAGGGTDKILPFIENGKKEGGDVPRYEVVDSMGRAVESARTYAQDGDVVLLSPGAASFGLFKNEFDRGDKFKEAVKNLK